MRTWMLLPLVGLLTTCTSYWSAPDHFSTQLEIVDENNEPVAHARVDLDNKTLETNEQGVVTLDGLASPVLAVVEATGYLLEPVPLGWESSGQRQRVRLLSDKGGKRLVMHFGGDVMFGRRYEEVVEGEPLIPPDQAAQGASQVVEPIRRLFSIADFRVINLETVVTELPFTAAYPGKRFLLRSNPNAIQALLDLGTDVVTAANNHSRDFLDIGVADTNAALERLRIPQVGGGLDAASAEKPVVIERNGTRIGVLSYTSVTGSFVNDNYPRDAAAQPGDVQPKELWLYQKRLWQSPNPEWEFPAAERRIGEVWARYSAIEDALSAPANAQIWASMVAVYPELQDWVARRGHGGAAMWDTHTARQQVQQLREQADLVIVQLHAGFQFQPAPSDNVRDAAKNAIDAGADAVICHHPHVLQGVEWYEGKLIVYSLGNFIFDQDFLSTFASGVLRMVWEGQELVEARFVPTVLQAYKPTPVVDGAARRVLMELWERSNMQASSLRDDTNAVRVRINEEGMASQSSQFIIEHNTAKIVPRQAALARKLTVSGGQTVALPRGELTLATLGLKRNEGADIWLGRDLFGWGNFEDDSANQQIDGAMHWALGSGENKYVVYGDAALGRGYLRLHKWSGSDSKLIARSVARIPLTAHRFWQGEDGDTFTPTDPPARYSFRFKARIDQAAPTAIVIDIYHFDDSDPTEDPESVAMARVELPFTLTPGEDWIDLELDFDPTPYDQGKIRANMILPYLAVSAPDDRTADLDVDDFTLIEWRQAALMPPIHGAYTLLRNSGERTQELTFSAYSAYSDHPVEIEP